MAVDIPQITQYTIRAFSPTVPIDQATQDRVLALFTKMRDTMPWVPYDLYAVAKLAFDQGQYPYPSNTLASVPKFLADQPDRKAYWIQVANQFNPITTAIGKASLAEATNQAQILGANADFWNNVAYYTGEAYLEDVWNKLWEAIANLRSQRDATSVHLQIANDIIAQNAGKVPANLVSNTNAIRSQFDSLTARAKSTLAPLGSAGLQESGLGAALIIAGIAAAAIIALTASIWAIAHEFANVQINAANNAQAMIKWRDAQDHQDFAAGKINNAEFTARRDDTIKAATTVTETQGAAALGKSIATASSGIGKGIAVGLGAVALFGIAAYALFRYAKKKTS